MAITKPIKNHLQELKSEYDQLKSGKESLLKLIDEAEIPDSVYNSNAIENSTLTLKETEKILLDLEVSRNVSLREVFETKNLAKVMDYVRHKSLNDELDKELILFLHQMLLNNINDKIAGYFRKKDEYVKVGNFIAPAPENIEKILSQILVEYNSDLSLYFLDKIAKFHLDFETLHPFNDGNGRIGRVLINFQLFKLGFPQIIIRDKEKKDYLKAFDVYHDDKNTKIMEKILYLALKESFHKRLAYLKGLEIINLADYAKKINKPAPVLFNAAKRQNIPAFREKGIWKIGI